MNQSPEIPSADDALRAMNASVDDYSRRANAATSNGARTGAFEQGAVDYGHEADRLHGDLPPSQGINREQPVHILMCYMLASGKTPAEIATATGYSKSGVQLITRQPWFRKRFLRITAEAGKNEVESFLALETVNSLEVLVEVRDDKTEKGATRVSAANAILNRALGMPTQKVESESHNYNHKVESGSELDRQIAQAEEELKSLGHKPNTSGGN